MKKAYIKPITEDVVLNLGERLNWGDETILSEPNPHNTGDGKQNDFFFEEDIDDGSGELSWGTNPWEVKYNLWED